MKLEKAFRFAVGASVALIVAAVLDSFGVAIDLGSVIHLWILILAWVLLMFAWGMIVRDVSS